VNRRNFLAASIAAVLAPKALVTEEPIVEFVRRMSKVYSASLAATLAETQPAGDALVRMVYQTAIYGRARMRVQFDDQIREVVTEVFDEHQIYNPTEWRDIFDEGSSALVAEEESGEWNGGPVGGLLPNMSQQDFHSRGGIYERRLFNAARGMPRLWDRCRRD